MTLVRDYLFFILIQYLSIILICYFFHFVVIPLILLCILFYYLILHLDPIFVSLKIFNHLNNQFEVINILLVINLDLIKLIIFYS